MTTQKKQMRSVEAGRAAWKVGDITPSERLLLHALSSHADDHFECYPSLDRLAAMTRLSKRQVIRLIHSLRSKGYLSVEENRGGRSKRNHYRLLFALNGDRKADINSATENSDTLKNGDISSTETVTPCRETVTNATENGDTAMSPEWFEKFLEGVKEKGEIRERAPLFRPLHQVFKEVDSPDGLLKAVLVGPQITRQENCPTHGLFLRNGWLSDNWLLLEGTENIYDDGFSGDAGCDGCRLRHEKALERVSVDSRCSLPLRQFDLQSPAVCETHGKFIYLVTYMERSAEWQQSFGKPRLEILERWIDGCPNCEADSLYRADLMNCLGLSDEMWDRGGEKLLDAIAFARGEPRCESSDPRRCK